MASQRSLLSVIAAAVALLLALLTFCFADVTARASDAIASSTSTSTSTTSSPVPNHHRRRRGRGPVLGPRPVTGVRRRERNDGEELSLSKNSPAPSLSPGHPSDLLARCRELWRDAALDHFSGWKPRRSSDVDDDDSIIADKNKGHQRRRHKTPKTFKQRYFVCDDQWAGPGSPIFFYFGNEADVTLYLNATGLMWQSAPTFGAALVFAEHR